MHGSICVIVQKFVETNFGVDSWLQILTQAGVPELRFSPIQHYPDEAVMQVIRATCEHLKIEEDVALTSVGKFAAKELLRFAKHMLHPEWRTFEVLNNLESLIHRTVRLGNPGAEPADIQCHQISDSQIQVIYSSRRGLCALASGILSGMGEVFSQKLEIKEESCCKRGDPFCAFSVYALDECCDSEISPIQPLAVGTDPDTQRKQMGGVHVLKSKPKSLAASVPTVLEGSDSGESEDSPRNAEDWLHLLPPQIGRYRVVRTLGAGGMGVVFEGVDEELQRKVAIKTLKVRNVRAPDKQMFLSEARQLARLNHPRVVKIFDVGRIDKRPFFVMEWLDGTTLQERLNECSRLTFDLAANLFLQIVDALEAVHRIGIVHRDVKPGNVMVSRGGTACALLDFGLAESGTTQSFKISGTRGYLAPERLQGFPGDFRSDFYSLGVLSLEMFGGILVEQQLALNLHIDGFSERLSAIDEWNALDPNLKELIEGLLAVDAGQRVSDVAHIRSVLRRLVKEG